MECTSEARLLAVGNGCQRNQKVTLFMDISLETYGPPCRVFGRSTFYAEY